MASVATEEATTWTAGGRDREGSLLTRFEVEAATFGSSEDLFFVELPPHVFTIVSGSRRKTQRSQIEKIEGKGK